MQGIKNAVLLNLRTHKGPQGKNYNLYLFLLLGQKKELMFRLQLTVWSSGRQSFPRKQEEGIKTLSVKTEITQVAYLLNVHVHHLAQQQTKRKRANLIILSEALSSF